MPSGNFALNAKKTQFRENNLQNKTLNNLAMDFTLLGHYF